MDKYNKNYKTLVLSGGGSKGFVHIGALEYCWQLNYLSPIKRYWGVSVGSILCLFLVLNYTPQEIFQLFYKYGLFHIYDIDTSTIQASALMHIESLGDRIIDLLKSDFNRSTTFKQLYKKTGKHLNIIGTKMGSLDDKLEHFNHKKTPEMSIIDAIEISCALPFIFTEKIYNNVKYIDGCFVNELPIDMAEVTKSNKTLAIWIKSNNEQTSSLLNNIYNILTVSMNQLQYMRNKNVDRKYTDVIEIVADGVGFSDLNPSKKRQVEMWGVGYRQTEEFYSKIFMNGWEM